MTYEVQSTRKTPYLFFDKNIGLFKLSGRCISEHPQTFFSDLELLICEYVENPKQETILDITLEYANTSSTKCILNMLKKFDGSSSSTTLNWYYEKDDDDILEVGENFQLLFKMKMNFIGID